MYFLRTQFIEPLVKYNNEGAAGIPEFVNAVSLLFTQTIQFP